MSTSHWLQREKDQVIKCYFAWIPTGFGSGLISPASACSVAALDCADKRLCKTNPPSSAKLITFPSCTAVLTPSLKMCSGFGLTWFQVEALQRKMKLWCDKVIKEFKLMHALPSQVIPGCVQLGNRFCLAGLLKHLHEPVAASCFRDCHIAKQAERLQIVSGEKHRALWETCWGNFVRKEKKKKPTNKQTQTIEATLTPAWKQFLECDCWWVRGAFCEHILNTN